MPIGTITSEEVARRTMNLFFLVDTSGSMAGRKIGALNQAVRETLPIIQEISEGNADACIKVAVLEFSDNCKWMYDEPLEAKDFEWTDLGTNCLTSMGAALIELNDKMSRSKFMSTMAYQPVIIILSDGAPTDDFKHGMEKIQLNRWYQKAIKIAIAIGDDADTNVLAQFTGNREAVFTADNVYMLKKIIKLASVTSSEIGSKSQTTSGKSKQDQIIDKIIDDFENGDKDNKDIHPEPDESGDEDLDELFKNF